MSYASLEDAILNGSGTERSFLCHVHGDSNPSASVNSISGLWYCYACHACGKVDLDGVELSPYAIKRWSDQIQRRIEASSVTYPEGWLDFFDATPSRYWASRFSPEVIRDHRLGQTPDGKYATIPFRSPTGEVKGVIMRSLSDEDERRYRYPWGYKTSENLYGYHKASSDVLILVEGASDVVAADEVLPGHTMAIYGNRFSKAQAHLLYRYGPKIILVATDQDPGGELAYREIRDRMGTYCPVRRLLWDEVKDLAAMEVRDRSDLLEWATSEFPLTRMASVG